METNLKKPRPAPLGGLYEISISTRHATRSHETGNPDEPYWIEVLPGRSKYVARVINLKDKTAKVLESAEFGEDSNEQFSAYMGLQDFLSDTIARSILPKDKCPQYEVDEDGKLVPKQ